MNKVLILGHGRHGKDTFAEILAREHGLRFTSSSLAALDVIWPAMREAMCSFHDFGPYEDKAEAFKCRDQFREFWKELISLYNTPDKSTLCKDVLSKNDMYVGMRCDEEYEACKHMFSHIFWVDGSKRHGEDPSMKIKYNEKEMIYINNNGSLNDLHRQAEGVGLL